MNFKVRNLLAAAMTFVMMISLTACSSDKQKKYEQLKTDIVGVWCDIDGPEYFEIGQPLLQALRVHLRGRTYLSHTHGNGLRLYGRYLRDKR